LGDAGLRFRIAVFCISALVQLIEGAEHCPPIVGRHTTWVLNVENRVTHTTKSQLQCYLDGRNRCSTFLLKSACAFAFDDQVGVSTTNAGRSLFSLPRPIG
jgi:hypothetical protein